MEDNMHYDAIVVGSGITGGWAAKELTEKGLTVLLLERGRNIEHLNDYINADKEAWDYPHRGRPTQAMIQRYPVLSRDYVLNEPTHGMWTDEQDNPYIEEKRFDWYRAYQVGGRSLLWARRSFRWNRMDFTANQREGIAVDWPIRYEDLAPWYDYVESFAGIAGNRDGLDVLPDGNFLPPIPLNCVEATVSERISKAFGGTRHLIHSRVANITEPRPEQNRVNCQYRDKCWLGCPYGAYFSTQSATLPAAMATGNLTLRPFSIARQITYDRDKRKATGVEIIDAETNQTYEYTANVVFLNASAFNSTWILMNSATDVWEGGLGSSSGELGHNVMDHHFRVGARGEIDGFDDKYYFGRRPTGFYIPRFRNWNGDTRSYVRGFGYQGSASRESWNRNVAQMGIGMELKGSAVEAGRLDHRHEWLRRDAARSQEPHFPQLNMTDKWGLPVLRISVAIG